MRRLLHLAAMLHAFGLSRESELLGRTDYELVPAEIADEYREQDRRIQQAVTSSDSFGVSWA